MIKITLPDGSIREFEGVVTPLEVAKSISEGLARNTISAVVNGKQVEVTTPITEDATLTLLTWNDDLGKKAFWHSSAHILAQSILDFYPTAKLTIGPAIENGFYYDVDFGDESLSEKDFEKIEKKMLENAKKDATFNLYSVSKADALRDADCWLFGCWIAPEFRGQGLMKLIIDELDQVCREEGWVKQGLGVWPNNERAIRAYKRHGFYQDGEPRPSRSRPTQLYIPMFRYLPRS